MAVTTNQRPAGLDAIPADVGTGVETADVGVVETDADDVAPEPEADADEPEAEESDKEAGGALDPKTQAILDKRIGKEVGKRKAAEEARESSDTRLAEMQAELEGLKTESSREEMEAAFSMGIHPAYAAKPELETLQRHQALERQLLWLEDHEDGYEGPDASGNTVEWDEKQVRQFRRQVERQLRSIDLDARDIKKRATKQMLDDLKLGRETRLKGKLANERKGKTTTTAADKAKAGAGDAGGDGGGDDPDRIPGSGQPAAEREKAGNTQVDLKAIEEADDPEEEYRRQIQRVTTTRSRR